MYGARQGPVLDPSRRQREDRGAPRTWNLRTGSAGGADELTRILGSYIPLPLTALDHLASGDPRPSIEELYTDKNDYLRQVAAAARKLVGRGFMLEEDIGRVTARASTHWDWLHAD